jgi:4-amino-4-deoxy-L-arabinose transferase-like glycosyltransferase
MRVSTPSTQPRARRTWPALLALWGLSLATLTCVAVTLHNPGSLDACYHLHVAQNLAAGRGMVEDVIWNYLDKSDAALALPHASHLYWMPLTTWLAWLGIEAFGGLLGPFGAAQVPFVLLASLLPQLAFRLARHWWGRDDYAWLAGLLTLAAPNYLQVWVVPEPAGPFCAAAAACFLACTRAARGAVWYWPLAGAAAGLAHLTRSDGALVLLSAAWLASAARERALAARAADLLRLSGGYALIMAPWFARNLSLIGSPLPLSVTHTIWLHGYDEFFSYERPLTAARWFALGAPALLAERSHGALATCAQFCGMFQWILPPLAWLGWRRLAPEQRALVRPCALYALCLLATMSLLFTHPARFGSLFRGASALLPWGMALVPAGLARAADAYAKLRRAPPLAVQRAFARSLLCAIVVVAAIFHAHRLRGVLPEPLELWNERLAHYVAIDRWLRARGETGPVLVVDPPGFTLATGRPSIVVPSDGPQAVRAAADRFGARWLLLESNVPSLAAAFRSGASLPGFVHVRQFHDELGSAVQLLARSAP